MKVLITERFENDEDVARIAQGIYRLLLEMLGSKRKVNRLVRSWEGAQDVIDYLSQYTEGNNEVV